MARLELCDSLSSTRVTQSWPRSLGALPPEQGAQTPNPIEGSAPGDRTSRLLRPLASIKWITLVMTKLLIHEPTLVVNVTFTMPDIPREVPFPGSADASRHDRCTKPLSQLCGI